MPDDRTMQLTKELHISVIAAAKRHALETTRNLLTSFRYLAALLRMGVTACLSRAPSVRILIISDGGVYTSEEQLAPFKYFRQELRRRLRIESLRISLSQFARAPKKMFLPFNLIIVKLSFRISKAEAGRALELIRSTGTDKPIIYFDGDDDICIQWPSVLRLVDLYVKKHSFSDKKRYLEKFVGKSNLTDYVFRSFDNSFEKDPIARSSGPLPSCDLDKIVVGWNLAFDRKIVHLFRKSVRGLETPRDNDIVCRAAIPSDWLKYLRADILPIIQRMGKSYRVIDPSTRVTPDVYLREMRSSKICVSPFGYGEICWRDFEAILCGCLLVKPDMSHIETWPNIFIPFQTYVPIKWDFSDLEETCAYYLRAVDERKRIVSAAQDRLWNIYDGREFVDRVEWILGRFSMG
jgi:hypothetical protein